MNNITGNKKPRKGEQGGNLEQTICVKDYITSEIPKGWTVYMVNLPLKRPLPLTGTERECLLFLLEYPRSDRWRLGAEVGVGYTPNIVRELRKKGYGIITYKKPYKKRSGEWGKIGVYEVLAGSLEAASAECYGGGK